MDELTQADGGSAGGAPLRWEDEPLKAKKNGRPELYDWERIKAEVKAGQIAINQIARNFGIDQSTLRSKIARARAKGDTSWEPDLATSIAQQAKARLARTGASGSLSVEAEIMELAVRTRIRIVEKHQKDIRKIRLNGEKLLDRLAKFLDGEDTKPFKGDKESPADVLRKVSDAFRFVIPLERQAFGISDVAGSEAERPDQGGIAYLPPKKPLPADEEPAVDERELLMNQQPSDWDAFEGEGYDVPS